MADHDRQQNAGLSEQELEGQEAHHLPDREALSLLGGGSSPMGLPSAGTLPGLDGQGLDTQAYPGANPAGDAVPGAGGTSNVDLPAYSTADTNSTQTNTTATDTATS